MKANSGIKKKRKGIETRPKTWRNVALPFSENQLLRGLDAVTSHSDELATPSSRELGK